jgi:hypothetical protein
MKKIAVIATNATRVLVAGAAREATNGVLMRDPCSEKLRVGRHQRAAAAHDELDGCHVLQGRGIGRSHALQQQFGGLRPRARGSTDSVVSGGVDNAASGMSSKPVIAKSTPGRVPRACRPSINPSATLSL